MEEVVCVRNKQSRDVGRYDSMDGGGSAASGTAAEGNAGSSCRDARERPPLTHPTSIFEVTYGRLAIE